MFRQQQESNLQTAQILQRTVKTLDRAALRCMPSPQAPERCRASSDMWDELVNIELLQGEGQGKIEISAAGISSLPRVVEVDSSTERNIQKDREGRDRSFSGGSGGSPAPLPTLLRSPSTGGRAPLKAKVPAWADDGFQSLKDNLSVISGTESADEGTEVLPRRAPAKLTVASLASCTASAGALQTSPQERPPAAPSRLCGSGSAASVVSNTGGGGAGHSGGVIGGEHASQTFATSRPPGIANRSVACGATAQHFQRYVAPQTTIQTQSPSAPRRTLLAPAPQAPSPGSPAAPKRGHAARGSPEAAPRQAPLASRCPVSPTAAPRRQKNPLQSPSLRGREPQARQ
jgi:hypothetical protein